MKAKTYYHGDGTNKCGIYNTVAKQFQFGICEDTPSQYDRKEYEIEEDCMLDKEHGIFVPTIWTCGRCHARVNKTDIKCWHCNAKLKQYEG